MKIKKYIKFKDGNQVWRILISPTGKLIVETRNPEAKEAYFSCIDLRTSKKIFKSFQFDDKYWIGIEEIYNDVIFLHRFSKPDMPAHKSIIAFDINTKEVLWENKDYSFLFLYEDKIYAFSQRFEGRQFYTLNPKNGELIEELGSDQLAINEIKYKADDAKDYSKYMFPEPVGESDIIEPIKNACGDAEIVGAIECVKANNFLIFNFHVRVISNFLENRLFVYNFEKNKVIIKDILNSSVVSAVPDSFFIYDNYLILLKEKSEVIVYKME